MSVSPDDFLDQACRLMESEAEIDQRSAISRSYYAAYHEAKNAAQRLGLRTIKTDHVGAHEQLIARYEANSKRLKIIAGSLRSKKRMRAVADYQLDEPVTRAEAKNFLLEIKGLVRQLGCLGRQPGEVAE